VPACSKGVRAASVRLIVLLSLVASACEAGTENITQTERPSPAPAAVRLAVAPPLIAPDGRLRFVTTPSNELRAEDVFTGAALWTVPARIPAAAPTTRWYVLVSDDASSVYAQSVSAEPGLTYQGTQRIEARTGIELANDIKFEIYWYQNVVLWTALRSDGKLQMAVQRPTAAGGGYWLRTFDPLTLRMLTDVPQTGPPPVGGR
jgi:hypothetical protein